MNKLHEKIDLLLSKYKKTLPTEVSGVLNALKMTVQLSIPAVEREVHNLEQQENMKAEWGDITSSTEPLGDSATVLGADSDEDDEKDNPYGPNPNAT